MKVVCTGYGIMAPNTKNIEAFLFNLKNGVCSLEIVEQSGPKNETNIVGLIKKELEDYEIDPKLKRLPRVTKLGIAATREAVKSAQIDLKNKKVGLFIGTSLGASGEKIFQDSIEHGKRGDYRSIPITFSHYANYHSITAAIARSIGINGITKTITTACTSSLEAIEEALLYLRSGKVDVAIVGGTDSPITQATTYAFAKTRSLPLNQSLDEGAVPFNKNSKGFAMAEAAGAIILEREEDAVHRAAHIKGEMVEVVSNNDGIDIFSIDETGEQMLNALKEIITGRQPDYINSQALGIGTHDQIEYKCSKLLFNHQIPYSSIKSMYGNPFGVVGILQVISSFLSVQYDFIPPTIRTSKNGFEDMNIVTETKYQEIKEVAITNHGHAGNNACAYVKKY
ncbi:beta-ketoacyl synthase N-terminal-like domain-containing protein [Bacillus sp. FJAT-50079]|uniref:beta-ketoacyl synthase N-terminal-like domain-containing protein n=1 Tax=Bacillus sp. FJAT-50079 TaxID=2833577 RepID=UPI001BCA1229|nr:beta-ketoacyl synthase N-terminal-like domain-containing protein [Bacillus sp. FJAT-50079]MBS4210158.1 beta-ketoacyl synthase [Bacillus sp. FJAT-50079]